MGWVDFPVIFTCTLQGSSVTQGNPVTFTTITFAVQLCQLKMNFLNNFQVHAHPLDFEFFLQKNMP